IVGSGASNPRRMQPISPRVRGFAPPSLGRSLELRPEWRVRQGNRVRRSRSGRAIDARAPGRLRAGPVAGTAVWRQVASASGRIGAGPAAVCPPDRPETEGCGASALGRANGTQEAATSPQATPGPLQARGDAHPESTRAADLLSEEAIDSSCEQVAPLAGRAVRQPATPQNR